MRITIPKKKEMTGTGLILPLLRRLLGIRQLPVPPVVAMLLDQPASLCQSIAVAEETGAIELNVGLEQRHRAPLGDLPRFFDVRLATRFVARKTSQPGAGQ